MHQNDIENPAGNLLNNQNARRTEGSEDSLLYFKPIIGNITSPDVTNQSYGINVLNEVTLGDDSMYTIRINGNGENAEHDSRAKIIDFQR